MNKIQRDRYINRIISWIGKAPAKILVGQRRVGKSTLLTQVEQQIKEFHPERSLISINMEQAQWSHIRTSQDLLSVIGSSKVILIDEVQDIQGWEIAIRSLLSEENRDIYLTGSNSHMLSSELATYLAGRYVSFEIFPFTYDEYLEKHESGHSNKLWMAYLTYGGLPYISDTPNDESAKSTYLSGVVDTILLKDIIKRYAIRNVAFFEDLLKYLSSETGHILSAKNMSDYLKSQRISTSPNVILDYLSYCVDANLVFKVARYDIRGKKLFEIRQKYYFTDLGIRNMLVGGYKPQDISGILENTIAMHLRAYGWQIYVGEIEGREVDFIALRGEQKIYIQVAYLIASEDTREREFGSLKLIQDNHPKYVLSLDEIAGGNQDGIIWMYLPSFLLNILPTM